MNKLYSCPFSSITWKKECILRQIWLIFSKYIIIIIIIIITFNIILQGILSKR
jgi:hypothetical protein